MEDLGLHLTSADPSFDHTGTLMWIECSPEKKTQDQNDVAMDSCEKTISQLESDQNDVAWKADILKLAKDASMCAKVLQQAASNERTDRLAKITHIKEQNKIGAQLISAFMRKHCHHVTLSSGEAEGALSEEPSCKISGCTMMLSFIVPNNFQIILPASDLHTMVNRWC